MLFPIIEIRNLRLKNKVLTILKEIASIEDVELVEMIYTDKNSLLMCSNKACIPKEEFKKVVLSNPAIYIYLGTLGIENSLIIEKPQDIEKLKKELPYRIKISKIYSKLPKIDCKKCGFKSCYDFSVSVVNGERKISDCVVLASEKKVILKVNDKVVFLNPWVMKLFRKIILAMISSLKDVEIIGDEKIIIEVKR